MQFLCRRKGKARVTVWHKATIQNGLDSGAVEVTDDDLSDMPKPTDSCWWVFVFGVFGRLRFDAFVREGNVMNGENGKQEPLVKGGSLNEKKSRIVSYTVPGIAPLFGGGGNDLLIGGGGNDTVYAGGGSDIVYAGGGSDIVYADNYATASEGRCAA